MLRKKIHCKENNYSLKRETFSLRVKTHTSDANYSCLAEGDISNSLEKAAYKIFFYQSPIIMAMYTILYPHMVSV